MLNDGVVIPLWVMLIGACGISFGLCLFGPKLIRMVGNQITKLNPMRAYCVSLSAAITVILASWLGLPVSSTHIAIGAIFGVGFFREWDTERRLKSASGPALEFASGRRTSPSQAGSPLTRTDDCCRLGDNGSRSSNPLSHSVCVVESDTCWKLLIQRGERRLTTFYIKQARPVPCFSTRAISCFDRVTGTALFYLFSSMSPETGSHFRETCAVNCAFRRSCL